MTFDRKKIKDVLKPLVKETLNTESDKADLRRNTIDVFSQALECTILNITREEWEQRELTRQAQKTLQNKIGELHQKILGTIDGVQDLGVGEIVDLKGPKFIAEVKNKHNTTKGNHKVAIYDDLEKCLSDADENTIGYYVEILPPNGKSYDKPFTPSDNKTSTKRPENDRIRQIDGKTFYEKVTGNSNALEELYQMLPEITAEIIKEEFNEERDISDSLSKDEFDFIYKNKK
ncbi:Eco47II family restriction endonuclease [Aggregatibacter kilianii]|uniref:Eco47II family restriction endonuclease n=1 Tax=Aggregatibacter kilianii TaxID=2025884 RepID=UPI000D654D0A|nr:Eco47II family restriction endonuclease [Aggregatibacter kilianii]